MVVLGGELDDAKLGAAGLTDGVLDGAKCARRPERRHLPARAQGEVDGVGRSVSAPGAMGDGAPPPGDGRPPRPFPLPAPPRCASEWELLLRPPHLNRAII